MVPNLFFSLVGGLLADRLDRKRVLIAAQVLSMGAAAGIGLLTALGIIQIWHIVGLAFIGGLAMALSFPSWQSVVSDLVAEEDLINAVALNSAQFNLTRILGPTIGGFLIGWIGVVGCFFANAVSYLAVIYAVWRIQLPRRNPSQLVTDGILSSLREGFSLVRSSRSLQRVLIMGAGFTLFSMPYLTFMPVFARDILNAGTAGITTCRADSCYFASGHVCRAHSLCPLNKFPHIIGSFACGRDVDDSLYVVGSYPGSAVDPSAPQGQGAQHLQYGGLWPHARREPPGRRCCLSDRRSNYPVSGGPAVERHCHLGADSLRPTGSQRSLGDTAPGY
jgi:MFS family permease